MGNSLATCYKALHPAIRAHWTALLRSAPPSPASTRAVMTPAMLEFLVDETLDRLAARLQDAGGSRPQQHAPLPCALRLTRCQCGLHLLLTYYATGARALHESLPDDLGHGRLEIIRGFNNLAHDELAGLCGICHYREGPWCRLRAALQPGREAPVAFRSKSRPAEAA